MSRTVIRTSMQHKEIHVFINKMLTYANMNTTIVDFKIILDRFASQPNQKLISVDTF